MKPTLSADKIGRHDVETGYIRLNDCTDFKQTNCERQADRNTIINPVRSACLTTEKSFAFKYGHVEIVAKLPIGDWLWPGKFKSFSEITIILSHLIRIGQVHGQCEQLFTLFVKMKLTAKLRIIVRLTNTKTTTRNERVNK